MSSVGHVSVATGQLAYSAVANAVKKGLLAHPKWLPAWLFYDQRGSQLFEQITTLPEYYPTRTERAIFTEHAGSIVQAALRTGSRNAVPGRALRFVELGAGSASKTGVLLAEAVRQQGRTEYLPIDVSESALEEACAGLSRAVSNLSVSPQVANYVTDRLTIPIYDGPTLALYIGSSIGNFDPPDAVAILANLRARMRPGDSLLLGTDLVKDRETLLAAYNDANGVTAAFNLNLLARLNRELGANFDGTAFQHHSIWNEKLSRIEMHLCSRRAQVVDLGTLSIQVRMASGETIHTENSYKFTAEMVASMLHRAGFAPVQQWHDARRWFAVTLAAAQ